MFWLENCADSFFCRVWWLSVSSFMSSARYILRGIGQKERIEVDYGALYDNLKSKAARSRYRINIFG
jgi:hypothetical protein